MARDYEDPFRFQGLRPAGSANIGRQPTSTYRTSPVEAGTPRQQRNIDRFNQRYGSSSPGAQASRNAYADATGMSRVSAARARPGLGDAPVNSIIGSSGRTLSYDSRTGVATRGGTDPTYSGATYVAPGTSERQPVSTPQEDPLDAFGGPGPDVSQRTSVPTLRSNTVTAAASENIVSPQAAAQAQQAQQAQAAREASRQTNVANSEDLTTDRQEDAYIDVTPELFEKGGISRQQRAVIANQVAQRMMRIPENQRQAVMEDMAANNPSYAQLFGYDEFRRLMDLYMLRGQ